MTNTTCAPDPRQRRGHRQPVAVGGHRRVVGLDGHEMLVGLLTADRADLRDFLGGQGSVTPLGSAWPAGPEPPGWVASLAQVFGELDGDVRLGAPVAQAGDVDAHVTSGVVDQRRVVEHPAAHGADARGAAPAQPGPFAPSPVLARAEDRPARRRRSRPRAGVVNSPMATGFSPVPERMAVASGPIDTTAGRRLSDPTAIAPSSQTAPNDTVILDRSPTAVVRASRRVRV